MTNVLPLEAEQELWGVYRARFIIAGSAVTLAAAAIAALAFLPSYLVLHATETKVAEQTTAANDAVRDQADIAKARAELAVLSPLLYATTTPTQILSLVLSLRPSGVFVEHLNYTPGTLIVSGSGGSREKVDAYRKALAADPHFSSAAVPVSDLAGAQGGKFSITLSGAF